MAQNVVQTLKGFRDIMPSDARKRQWVKSKIIAVFDRFGFAPIETPTLEYASLLKGKYGEEADKLLYTFTDRGEREVGLRYDQTVPTARFIAQHKHELPKFFGRYQIQNIFRAEKPQQGRYREVTHCDIDYFGAAPPIADAEILACIYEAYRAIGFTDVQLQLNDRSLLTKTILPFATEIVSDISIILTIDKLAKIKEEGVIEELVKKGLEKENAAAVLRAVQTVQKPQSLETIMEYAIHLGVPKEALVFTPTLARGLDYYTGLIMEAVIPSYGAGSVGGGGRYDNLLELLAGICVPAVGFAIGFDRTVEAADALGLLPKDTTTDVLISLIDERYVPHVLSLAAFLRKHNKTVTVYPQVAPIGKQLQFADAQAIPYVVLLGENEYKENCFVLKNMKQQTQERISLHTPEQLLTRLQ